MNTCIFCGAEAAVNLGTARASCNPCHDFVFSDVETIHQAFRLGALMAARVNVTGDLVREIVREALGFKAPKTLPVGTLKKWH